jgi:predicted nucleic acid-binding protein
MPLYLDTSALLKRYIAEPDSAACEERLLADPVWITARHTLVEARRNLARLLAGDELAAARRQLADDWRRINVVELDAVTCDAAAAIAEATGARTLDALHLAAASRLGVGAIVLMTFDAQQARAARALGLTLWEA